MVVLDGSVLVEMVVEGRHADGARVLLEDFADRGQLLVTAAHGLFEAANALRNLAIRGDLDAESASRGVRDLALLDLQLDSPVPRLDRVWALRDTMTAYDAAYAAAAEGLGAPLLSVDGRLIRACATLGIAARHLDDLAA